MDQEMKNKIALFCTVPSDAVIEVRDEPTIYNVPFSLHRQGLDTQILRALGLPCGGEPDLSDWHRVVDRFMNAPDAVEIALVGKYVQQRTPISASWRPCTTRACTTASRCSLDRKSVV